MPLNEMAVVVLRVDDPAELPEGLFSNEEEITFLKDGAFCMFAGAYKAGAKKRALDAIAEAFAFGFEPLAFHQDPRGVRWAPYADFMNAPSKEIRVPGQGRYDALDLSYESAVSGKGLWVSVDEVYARIAELKKTGEKELKVWGKKMSAYADTLPEPEDEADPEPPAHNVVVVINPPTKLHKEIDVLATLDDGTLLVVGPKHRGWVDALKRNPGPASLRLIKGPVIISTLAQSASFRELDVAMRARGTPMLVMPG